MFSISPPSEFFHCGSNKMCWTKLWDIKIADFLLLEHIKYLSGFFCWSLMKEKQTEENFILVLLSWFEVLSFNVPQEGHLIKWFHFTGPWSCWDFGCLALKWSCGICILHERGFRLGDWIKGKIWKWAILWRQNTGCQDIFPKTAFNKVWTGKKMYLWAKNIQHFVS